MQYQVNAESFEVFCQKCAIEVAKEITNLDGMGTTQVSIAPVKTLRSKVHCGRCTDWIEAEVQSA